VIGVRLSDGTDVRSAAVMSNADVKRTFLSLLDSADVPRHLRQRIESLATTVSAYKLLGVLSELPEWTAWDGDVEEMGAGGVLIGASRSRITRAYDDIDAGQPTRRPLISVSVPSARDDRLAPAGFHTLSCYIAPAPGRLAEGHWDDVRDDVARGLVDEITEHAPNLKRALLEYRLRTPADLERENALTDGCIWHVGHGTDQLFWNRPLPELSRYRGHLPGLYLCGAGQHPAGEVSGQPGHNAAHELIRDLQ
jgi:phytoene dehydrogenase-like protein